MKSEKKLTTPFELIFIFPIGKQNSELVTENYYEDELSYEGIKLNVALHTIVGTDNYGAILKNAAEKHNISFYSPNLENQHQECVFVFVEKKTVHS